MKHFRLLLTALLLWVGGVNVAQSEIEFVPSWTDYVEGVIVPSGTTQLIVPEGKTKIKYRSRQWPDPNYNGFVYDSEIFSPFERNCKLIDILTYNIHVTVANANDYSGVGDKINLEEIVLPTTLTECDNRAFYNLSSLKRIYFQQTTMNKFDFNLHGSNHLEEIHLACDKPDLTSNPDDIPSGITLYVPERYYSNYTNDSKWTRVFTNIVKDKFCSMIISNPNPGVQLEIDNQLVNGSEGQASTTMYFGKYSKPKYCLTYDYGIGTPTIKLNNVVLSDTVGHLNLLSETQGVENTLMVTFDYIIKSKVYINSNGNGSTVSWDGQQVVSDKGGTSMISNVIAGHSYVMKVKFNPASQYCTVKKDGATLNASSTGNDYYAYTINNVNKDCNIDVQVDDKRCELTISKINIDANLLMTRMLDGKASTGFLVDGQKITVGQGTTVSFDVPNTIHLTTASLSGLSPQTTSNSNGTTKYTFTIPNSANALLTLVGQKVTVQEQSNYNVQTITKIGNGSILYDYWVYEEQDEDFRHTTGELTAPVTSLLTPISAVENGTGFKLTLIPNPGYELSTLYASWDTGELVNGRRVMSSVNLFTENSWEDNEGTHPHLDGKNAEQCLAEGGDFTLTLEEGRYLAFNVTTNTWTFTVQGDNWASTSMSITAGFSNPQETVQKQVNLMAIGTPPDGSLLFSCNHNGDWVIDELTSTGSITRQYIPGEISSPAFIIDYEEGRLLENEGVTIPFTVYRNGADVTSLFSYEDGQILYEPLDVIDGTWTFVFPEGSQTAAASPIADWSLLKIGNGTLRCDVTPVNAESGNQTCEVGNEAGRMRLMKAEVQNVLVSIQCNEGSSFKAFNNGYEMTSSFTTADNSLYTLTINQTDLDDAAWTVVFNEQGAANYYSYQLQQTDGGSVYVKVNNKETTGGEATESTYERIKNGSMNLKLSEDKVEGVSFLVLPDDDMTFRIYDGDTDITSQFVADENSNAYQWEATSLTDKSILFVFADKKELGIDQPEIIQFADANVKAICVTHWDTDGDLELSVAEAEAVTTLMDGDDPVFKGNTSIVSFDEFKYFTGLNELPAEAFQGCTKLESIVMPESLTSWGYYAFFGCEKLSNFVFPKNITVIPRFCFAGCNSFTSFTVPEGVTTISTNAFRNCKGITNILLPQTLTTLEGPQFDNSAQKIKTLVIPSSVTSISGSLLSNFDNLVVESGNTKYDSREGCGCIIETASDKILFGSNNARIPNGIKTIGFEAFKSLKTLKMIELPNSITSIGNYAFAYTNSLKSVVSKIENPQIVSLGTDAFKSVNADCVLTVPNGTKEAYIQAGWTTKETDPNGIFLRIEEASSNLEGDVNNDNKVTIADAVKVVDIILNDSSSSTE